MRVVAVAWPSPKFGKALCFLCTGAQGWKDTHVEQQLIDRGNFLIERFFAQFIWRKQRLIEPRKSLQLKVFARFGPQLSKHFLLPDKENFSTSLKENRCKAIVCKQDTKLNELARVAITRILKVAAQVASAYYFQCTIQGVPNRTKRKMKTNYGAKGA